MSSSTSNILFTACGYLTIIPRFAEWIKQHMGLILINRASFNSCSAACFKLLMNYFLVFLRNNFGKWTMIQWQTGAFHSFTSLSFRVGVSHLPCMCGFWHWIVGLWFFWQAWINTSPSLALWWLSLMDGESERALEGNSTNANLKGTPPPQLALSTASCCFFN